MINIWQEFLNDQSAFGELFKAWVVVLGAIIFLCFVVGELTQNFSQVDKTWSIMPIIYGAITLYAFPDSPRIWLMTILVAIWGLRLSYNFYRKGGYHKIPWKGEEDYRWSILRANPMLKGRLRTTLFNLLFISIYQQVLIMLFSTPLLIAAKFADTSIGIYDFVVAAFVILFILIETIADNQLFDFHLQKQNKIPRDGRFESSLKNGFMIDGLWKYVRHPNFAAEQMIWVSFYFFSVVASGEWINWTLSGAVLLVLLFVGSSQFTESISKKKYPDYEKYQKNVPKFIPSLFKI